MSDKFYETLLNVNTDNVAAPMYPQGNLWSVTNADVCELFGDGDELLATFGREGVTVYSPNMQIGKSEGMYLHHTHGIPSLQQWDGFVTMVKVLFGSELTMRDCPNFLQKALVDREIEHVTE